MKILNLLDVLTDYDDTEVLMDKTRDDVVSGFQENTIIVVQHEDVLTCGNQKPEAFPNHEIKHINRGGGLTYHNAGQVVFYFIVNLKTIEKSIHEFIKIIELATINTLKHYDITANNDKETGVWIGDEKVASIGLNVKKHITKYGMAINVNNDLSFFKEFTPCNIKGCKMTSVSKIKHVNIDIKEFALVFVDQFAIMCK